EARNRVELKVRLASEISLHSVIGMQAVVLSERLANINRALVNIYGSSGRAYKTGRAVDDSISPGNYIEQLDSRRVGRQCSLRIAQHVAVERESLSLPE